MYFKSGGKKEDTPMQASSSLKIHQKEQRL